MEISRESKLKLLDFEAHSKYISDGVLDLFYEKYTADMLKNKIDIDMNMNIDENSYKGFEKKLKELITLKFVNKIRSNAGLDSIKDLHEFEMNKNNIITEQNELVVTEMENEIFGPFNKKKCRYNIKNNQHIINLLKGMLNEIGYDLVKKSKDKKYNNGAREWIVTYTIKKI